MAFVLVIVSHPVPGSFNHSIAGSAENALLANSHTVMFHDLYEDRFDPVLSGGELSRRFSFDPEIQRYYEELSRASGIVIVHPDWWGQPPAILKGWIDRVLRPGIAYDFEGEDYGAKHRVLLLSGKKACVFCTSDYEGRTSAGHPVVRIWKDFVFGYCGAEATVKLFHPVRTATPARKNGWISEAGETVRRAFPRDTA